MMEYPASLYPCIAILGPTASGKSRLAFELAQYLDSEIVSCDSMQVYRQMDIGTAKPSRNVRRRIPHHLMDIVDIHEPYNVNRFLHDALRAIKSISSRGKTPILCGGTGLYVRALSNGYTLLPTDEETAAAVSREYARPGGKERLQQELAAHDRDLGQRQWNPRHLIRAVEIARLTGRAPMSSRLPSPWGSNIQQYVLTPRRPDHRQWIRYRTYSMFRAGWMTEVKSLLRQDWLRTPTARQALGYRRIAQFLLTGNGTTKELQQRVFHDTWKYARRQRTWFRNQHPEAVTLAVDDETDLKLMAYNLATRILPGKVSQ